MELYLLKSVGKHGQSTLQICGKHSNISLSWSHKMFLILSVQVWSLLLLVWLVGFASEILANHPNPDVVHGFVLNGNHRGFLLSRQDLLDAFNMVVPVFILKLQPKPLKLPSEPETSKSTSTELSSKHQKIATQTTNVYFICQTA